MRARGRDRFDARRVRRYALFFCVSAVFALLPALSVASGVPADGSYDANQVLVTFKDGVSAPERAVAHDEAGADVGSRLGALNTDIVDLPKGETVGDAIREYQASPDVLVAEPNFVVSVDALPNDPYLYGNGYGSETLWGLNNLGQSGGTVDADIDAPEGWEILGDITSPRSVGVAIIDTGIAGHSDLLPADSCYSALSGNGTLIPGCADGHGHGSHVAGTVSAKANNGIGVAGVGPSLPLYICKGLNDSGWGYTSDIAACITKIANDASAKNVKVLSMSLGSSVPSITMETAVNYATSKGVLAVAAAGNSGDTSISYPAGYENVVSVAATDRNDNLAYFSQRNSDVEIAAPGVSIVSTYNNGSYAVMSGTSMATPHVAGVAALIAEKYPTKNVSEVRSALGNAVDDLGNPGRDTSYGHGRVNLCLALGGTCGSGPGPNTAPTANFSSSPATVNVGDPIFLDASTSTDPDGTIVSYAWDISGDGVADGYGKYVTVVFTKPGVMEVKLTVTDDRSGTASTKRSVTVVANSVPASPDPGSGDSGDGGSAGGDGSGDGGGDSGGEFGQIIEQPTRDLIKRAKVIVKKKAASKKAKAKKRAKNKKKKKKARQTAQLKKLGKTVRVR